MPSVMDAINGALKEQGLTADQIQSSPFPPEAMAPVETEKPKEEKVEEPKVEEEPKEEIEETEDSGKEDEDLARAYQIAQILKDPAQARLFGETLVKQFSNQQDKQPEEKRESAEDLINHLAKVVGEDNQHLLQPIVQVFTELAQRREKVLLTEIQRIDNERLAERIELQTSNFIAKNSVENAEVQKLAELTKIYPQIPTLSLDTYLSGLLKIVRADAPKKAAEGGKEPTINKEKVKANLQSKKNEIEVENTPEVVKRPVGKITPKMAAEMAMRNQRFADE